jgi:hypothetical protein
MATTGEARELAAGPPFVGASSRAVAGGKEPPARNRLVHAADDLDDLDRLRPELLGELILDRLGRLDEA